MHAPLPPLAGPGGRGARVSRSRAADTSFAERTGHGTAQAGQVPVLPILLRRGPLLVDQTGVPWSLRYVVVDAYHEPAPERDDEPVWTGGGASMARVPVVGSFHNGLSQSTVDRVQQALDDGWEPFSVASLCPDQVVMWFRKLTGPEPRR